MDTLANEIRSYKKDIVHLDLRLLTKICTIKWTVCIIKDRYHAEYLNDLGA